MKIGTIVILVVIVIGALIIGLVRTGVVGGDRVPADVLARPVTVIDVQSLETREVTTGDWERRFNTDPATGYKIDSDGRKVASPMTCASCGERIPPAPMSAGIDDPEEHDRIMMGYECPKCGDKAYEDMGF